MKRTLIWLSAIILCVVTAAFCLIHHCNNGYIAERISSATLKATGSPLVFGQNPSLSFFPLAVNFGQARWESSGTEPSVTFVAKSGRVELELLPILLGKLALRDITLDRPVLEIDAGSPSPAAGKESEIPGACSSLPELGRLMAQGGTLVWKDADTTLRLERINFSAENLRKRQEADIKCDFTVNWTNRESGIKNVAGPVPAGNLAFKGKIRLYEPNLTFRHASATFTALDGKPAKEFSPLRLAFDGAINLDTSHFQFQMANLVFPQGSIELKGEGNFLDATFDGQGALDASMARLAGYLGLKPASAEESRSDTLIVAGSVKLDGTDLNLSDLAIKLGSGAGSGAIRMKLPAGESPFSIDGHISMGKVAFKDYSLPDTEHGSGLKTRTNGEQTEKSGFPGLNVRIDVAGLACNKLRIANLGFLLHGQAGKYRLDDFTMHVANGGVSASVQADLSTHDLALQANGMDMDLGAALEIFGIDGLEGGKTTFKADLHARGGDLNAIKKTLYGKGWLEARGLKIAVLSSISDILRLFGHKNTDLGTSSTAIKTLFLAENGKVSFSPITASSGAASLEGTAVVDLAKSYLDGTVSIRALGLDLPVTFSGPFEDIKLGVNPEAILNANRRKPAAASGIPKRHGEK